MRCKELGHLSGGNLDRKDWWEPLGPVVEGGQIFNSYIHICINAVNTKDTYIIFTYQYVFLAYFSSYGSSLPNP